MAGKIERDAYFRRSPIVPVGKREMGNVCRSAKVTKARRGEDPEVSFRRKRRALSRKWWFFVIFLFVASVYLILTWLLSFIFTTDAAASKAVVDWIVVLGIPLALPIVFNTVVMFINFHDNPTMTRVFLFLAMAASLLYAAAATVLLIYAAIVSLFSGVGRFRTYAWVMIFFLAGAVAACVALFVVMLVHWWSARAYETYGVKNWFVSKFKRKGSDDVDEVKEPLIARRMHKPTRRTRGLLKIKSNTKKRWE